MALATRCPACSTIFRISTAQAAAKGGMVRCGQCRHVFNSLDALVRVEDLEIVDEEELEPTVGPVEADTGAEPVTEPQPEASTVEPAPATVGKAVFSEWWLPAVAVDTVRPESSDDAPAVDEPAAPAAATGAERDFGGQSLTGRRTDAGAVAIEPSASQFLQEPIAAPPRSRGETWLLASLSAIALLFLLAQATYVWRNEVASRWPVFTRLLVAACAPLRCIVDYPAHPESITIEATAVQSTAPNSNRYVLNALLRNRDANVVGYPHLELVLTDVQDQPIFRRALRPEDYLAESSPVGGFAAQSELPIRLTFELDDLRFAGYRLESFYP